jgi:type VI secretion system protein ImpH
MNASRMHDNGTRGVSAPQAARLHEGAPWRFTLASATRLLELLRVDGGGAIESRYDNVRLRNSLSPMHPATEIEDLRFSPIDGSAQLTLNHPALLGAMGKLPSMYNRLVLDTNRDLDTRLQEFLDLLQDAIVRLYIDAKDICDPRRDRERMQLSGISDSRGARRLDRFAHRVLQMIGLHGVSNVSELSVHPDVFVRHAGLFLASEPTARGLENILTDYFDVRATVCDGVYRKRHRWRRPGRHIGGARPAIDLVQGKRPKRTFRVSLGPLTCRQFSEFAPPGGKALRPLVQLTRLYVGEGYRFDIRLRVLRHEVRRCVVRAAGEIGPAIDWNCWLTNGEPPRTHVECIVPVEVCSQSTHSPKARGGHHDRGS